MTLPLRERVPSASEAGEGAQPYLSPIALVSVLKIGFIR